VTAPVTVSRRDRDTDGHTGPESSGPPERRSRRWRVAGHTGAVGVALALWAWALTRADLAEIGDYGLVTALPVEFFVALGVLTVSFCVAVVRRGTPAALLALHAVALVVILHATLPLLYDAPRYAYLYKHLGVVEYIAEHHSVDSRIDIYHNWPGFFVAAALFAEATGLTGTVGYAAWAQPLFGLACVALLPVAYRALSGDRRLVWLAVWFFVAANWIGQDYFSPQAFSYLLYLIVLGICFTWLRGAPVAAVRAGGSRWLRRPWAALAGAYRRVVNASLADRPQPTRTPPSAARQAAAGAALLAVFAVVVASHQLMPYALLGGVAGLAALRWVRPWYLPLLMLALVAAWGWYVLPFVTQELNAVVTGAAADDVTSNLADLSDASAGRATVAWASRVLTAAVAGMAALGVVRRLRAGYRDLPAVWLALTPGVLLIEPYGGEILMRTFFFALPWAAFLAAGLFFPRPDAAATWRKATALLVVSGVLLSALLLAYFGLEKANRVRAGEVDAARWFYEHAEPGSLLMLAAPNFPTRLAANYHEFPGFDYDVSLLQSPRFTDGLDGGDVGGVIAEIEGWRTYGYLMLSSSQVGHAELMGLTEPGDLDALEDALMASGRFELVYGNDDARLLRLLSPSAATGG
jgi:hypothetical protein